MDRTWEEAVAAQVKTREKGLSVTWENGKAVIACSRKSEYYRGLGWIRQWQEEGKDRAYIEEMPVCEHLTYMVDCSRNAVCSVSWLKKLLHWMAYMGYDRLMLYTEDTYEIKERPFFGWMRGRYTEEEIHQLDEYASELGIELVPCIQTLAHLDAIFKWKPFRQMHDTADILNTGDEETYNLIEDMIRTWSENVRSRTINIGMDEAEMIGRGSFLNRFGYEDRFDIMSRHLNRVLQICAKYGFTCMMWSDMFFKLISRDSYYSGDIVVTEEILSRIPANVELIYWDYYSRDSAVYERMLRNHLMLSPRVGFAGGAWKWSGFAPMLNHSLQASGLALDACTKYNIGNIIVTGWGDDGGEAAQACVLPVLQLYAEKLYGNEPEDEWLANRLKACTGADFKAFLCLDLPNLTPDNPSPGRVGTGPARYLLFQDVMLGIYDRHVDERYPGHYKKAAEALKGAADNGGSFAYLFETLSSLCSVLEYKCSLGIDLRKAYLEGDKERLAELARRALETEQRTEVFRQKLCRQWFLENKPFGWEVQDIRLAGVKARLHSAAQRITDYIQGRTERLEELEEPRLLLEEQENPAYIALPLYQNRWRDMVTASMM